jgi:hypothetical protein
MGKGLQGGMIGRRVYAFFMASPRLDYGFITA